VSRLATTTTSLLASGRSRLLAADIPAPTGIQPPGTEGLTTILGWIAWGVTFLCVVGVFFVARRAPSDVHGRLRRRAARTGTRGSAVPA
jgi:hypothetical protein